MTRSLKIAALTLLVLALFAFAGVGWLVIAYPSEHAPGRGKTASVDIEASTSVDDVAGSLAAQGLVARPQLFALYLRVLGATQRLRQGHVLVTDAMSMRELLQRVANGFGSTEIRITIPEGWNRFEIAARLALWGVCERDAFLRATEDKTLLAELDADAPTAEGYLFPDTYRLRDGVSATAVVRRMIDNGRARIQRLLDGEASGVTQLHDQLGLGLHGLVTLASIVEKEAHAPDEQPIIAGVFWNRLHDPSFRPKRLQADPTVAYGCIVAKALPSCLGFDGKRVTRVMTADPENLYNTYRLDGLPPGPIANPGLGALRAVLHPAQHGFFYFVARGDGRHDFSASLREHLGAVQSHRSE